VGQQSQADTTIPDLDFFIGDQASKTKKPESDAAIRRAVVEMLHRGVPDSALEIGNRTK
jgi:hypothetical protein